MITVFRPVAKGGRIQAMRLTDRSVAAIVKAHAQRAGLDPKLFAGHSLRSGFLTSAAARGASIFKMADQSRHKSMDTLRVTSGTQRFSKTTAAAGYSEERIASPSILMADIAGPSCRQPAENLPSRNRAAPVSIPAMPAPVIVNPTCSGAIR